MLQSAKVSLSKIKLFMTKFPGTPHSLSLSETAKDNIYLLTSMQQVRFCQTFLFIWYCEREFLARFGFIRYSS